MLALPRFLTVRTTGASAQDVADGFRMTGFFLDRHVFAPRGLTMPEQRAALSDAVLKAFKRSAGEAAD
jgi:DNA repair protein RecO (recombination protein O)